MESSFIIGAYGSHRQLDSETGRYEDIGEQTLGHKGRTLSYRKIQNLEHDDLFREYLSSQVFEESCRRTYGKESVTAFRIMFFNKPAGKGIRFLFLLD